MLFNPILSITVASLASAASIPSVVKRATAPVPTYVVLANSSASNGYDPLYWNPSDHSALSTDVGGVVVAEFKYDSAEGTLTDLKGHSLYWNETSGKVGPADDGSVTTGFSISTSPDAGVHPPSGSFYACPKEYGYYLAAGESSPCENGTIFGVKAIAFD